MSTFRKQYRSLSDIVDDIKTRLESMIIMSATEIARRQDTTTRLIAALEQQAELLSDISAKLDTLIDTTRFS